MRRPTTTAYALFVAAILPVAAFAHPGHDHGHWSSAAIHSTFTLSLLALAGAGILWAGRRLLRKRAQLRVENKAGQ